MLLSAEKQTLLTIAVGALCRHLAGKAFEPVDVSGPMEEPRGAFVAWRRSEELRGCICNILPSDALWLTVQKMAVASGARDCRFAPISLDEIEQLHVEISALTPCTRVEDLNDIQLGVHGLFIRKEEKSGVLLPQVPLSQGWDLDEFLWHTCRKAGLDGEEWRKTPDIVHSFGAEVFGEDVKTVLE